MSGLLAVQKKLQNARPTTHLQAEFTPDWNVFLSTNLNGDYSVTPQDVGFPPQFAISGQVERFFGLRGFFVRFEAAAPLDITNYGPIGAGLVNGYNFWFSPDNGVTKIPVTGTIFTNSDIMGILKIHELQYAGFDPIQDLITAINPDDEAFFYYDVTQASIGGQDLIIGATLNDNFTSLASHTIGCVFDRYHTPGQWSNAYRG